MNHQRWHEKLRKKQNASEGRGRHREARWEDCFQCQSDLRRCKEKIRFTDFDEVMEWVDELNTLRFPSNGPFVKRYTCQWCGGWHMATVRTKYEKRRMERARRKWLISQL